MPFWRYVLTRMHAGNKSQNRYQTQQSFDANLMDYDNFTVSVIIPAFNAEKYIAEAIQSVLLQTSPASEIIVVDDGSADGTREVIEKHRGVRYVYQENAGVAAALNRGCRLATSNYIAFISADDVWRPDKLQQQKACMLQRPQALIFGHMKNFISPELAPDEAIKISCPKEAMPAYSAGTLLTRLDNFNQIGPFNESLIVGEFVEWYGRAKDHQMEVVMMDAVVSMRRLHKSNHSKRVLKNSKSYAPALKAILDRRRAKASVE